MVADAGGLDGIGGVGGVGLVVGAAAVYYQRGAGSLRPLTRLDLNIQTEDSPRDERGTTAILSPDGTQLVYLGHSRLFVRRLDQATSTELAGTEQAHTPFFSPDGHWVAFFSANRLKKISLDSGQVIDLGRGSLGYGGSWGEDGSIVAATDVTLSRIAAGSGARTSLTALAPGEIAHRWPQILPGARAVLFTAYSSMTGLEGATVEVQSLPDGRRKTLVRGGTFGRYVPSGHLTYISKGTLFAVSFDPDRMEVRGTPTAVLDEVSYSAANGSAQIDFSRSGTAVYRSSRAGTGLVTVQWLNAAGNTRPLLPVPGNYLSPALSPDGRRLALTSAGDIWVYELGRESMKRLTYGGGHAVALWTPDGKYVLFRARSGIGWARADGAGEPQTLTRSAAVQTPWSFTPDGRRVAFVESSGPNQAALCTVPVESDRMGLNAGKVEVFLKKAFPLSHPMISPDGRWLAYTSNQKGPYQVYVMAFPGGGHEWRISHDGGNYPAWSRYGHEIYFWRSDEHQPQGQLMVASWQARGDAFVAEEPRAWTGRTIASFTTTRSYDPALDGRVVALMAADAPAAGQDYAIFLLNFFDELRRRVPRT